jgi:exopolysaccharide biosynthesis polyprenyl glycosylphosphotransferase
MRVAKSNQLRRLLQTQDVVLSVLALALAIDIAWIAGFMTLDDVANHLKLLPLAACFGIVASITYYPRLHRQTALRFFSYALRYAAITVVGFALIALLASIDWINRSVIVSYFACLTPMIFINRIFLRWWYLEGRQEHRANYLKVVVIGTGPRARKLIDTYRKHVDWSIEVVACVDPQARGKNHSLDDDIRVINGFEHFHHLLASEIVDEVVVCLPRSMLNTIDPVARACEEQGICLKFLADLVSAKPHKFNLEFVAGLPILDVEPVVISSAQILTKRLLDIVATIIVLAVCWPLFLLIAISIKLDSKGPVLFVQKRIGLNKRPFQMYKFRSMYADAEERLAEVESANEAQGPIFKIANDPRMTRVGRYIRRFSLDELPQFLNILMGHMSLIGPRPMSARDVALFDEGIQQRRFCVRPGLACLREVEGRSALSFDRWLELDLQYIDTWSLALDFKIMLRVVPAVLSGKGAS